MGSIECALKSQVVPGFSDEVDQSSSVKPGIHSVSMDM